MILLARTDWSPSPWWLVIIPIAIVLRFTLLRDRTITDVDGVEVDGVVSSRGTSLAFDGTILRVVGTWPDNQERAVPVKQITSVAFKKAGSWADGKLTVHMANAEPVEIKFADGANDQFVALHQALVAAIA